MESASDVAVRASLARFDDSLLRAVAARLFKPRSQWPTEELIDRAVEALSNAPVIDRRLKDLPPAARHLLASIGLSGRADWPLGLGVVWQQLRTSPVRLTQSNTLFKRDLTRLQDDPLLGSLPTDVPIEVPEPGVLAMMMGMAAGLFVPEGGALRAGPFPASW